MTCERCGHEHSQSAHNNWFMDSLAEYQACIANLRADLADEKTACGAPLDRRGRPRFPVPMSHVVKVPAEPALRPTAVWWKAKSLGAAASQTTLGEGMVDVGKLCLAHLARRLDSSKTSPEVKDRIALAMAPKLVAEARGRPSRTRGALEAEAAPGDLESLLSGYRVTARTG